MPFGDNPVLDNFNRANAESLGANWTIGWLNSAGNSEDIVSNQAADDGQFVFGTDRWNVATYGPDTEVYITVNAVANDAEDSYIIGLRIVDPGTSSTTDGYRVLIRDMAGTDVVRIARLDNGVATQLGADITSEDFAVGDGFGLEAIGSTIAVYHRAGGTWSQFATRTDATYNSAGYIGIGTYRQGSIQLLMDDFGGGTVAGGAFTLDCDAGSYTITGQTTSLVVDRAVSLNQGSYSIAGQAASLLKGFTVALDQGSYSVAGQAVTLTVDRVLAAGQGSYVISGQVTELLVGHVIDLAVGSYTISGQNVTINKGFALTADLGNYTVSGQSIGMIASRVLTFELGSYAITGRSASLLIGRVIALAQGSYTLSGQDAGLLIARTLALNLGAYSVTGLDVTLTYTPMGGFTITLDLGDYSVTGQAANLIVDRSLALDHGNYAITGQAADLLRGFLLDAEQGSYTVAGHAANLLIAHLLALSSGAYSLTGLAATLDYSGAAGGGVVETIYKGIRRGIDKDMVHP